MSGKTAGKPFYGWLLVFYGILVMGVTHGIAFNCFSLYIIPICEDLGFLREQYSVCHMLLCLSNTLVSFFIGKIYRRFSPLSCMRVGAVLFPLSFLLYSFSKALPAFYASAVLMGFSVSFLTFLPFTQFINSWFIEKRGRALGFCFMGSGLGGMIMSALSSYWIEAFGWRTSYRFTVLVILAVVVPVSFFLIRPTPAAVGMVPYGAEKQLQRQEEPVFGPDPKAALRSGLFALMLVASLCIGLNTTVLSGIIVTHLQGLGFEASYAGTILSVYLGGLAVSKILIGGIGDKLGAAKSTMIAFAATLIGLLGLLFGSFRPAHVLIVLGASVGCASSTMTIPLMTRYSFGTRSYTYLYGIFNAANLFTAAFTQVFTNSVYTATGSYNLAILISIGLCVLSIAIVPFLRPVAGEGRKAGTE